MEEYQEKEVKQENQKQDREAQSYSSSVSGVSPGGEGILSGNNGKLKPLSGGLSNRTGAPMQAKGEKKWYNPSSWFGGSSKESETQQRSVRAEDNQEAEQKAAEDFEVIEKDDVDGNEKADGIDPELLSSIPLAWSRQISGDEEKEPKLGVHLKQQERGKEMEGGGLGMNSHAFLSLEYSRNSRIRGGKKRFRTAFGFYPKLKIDNIGGMGQGGNVPGALENDIDHKADVSKTFPISYRQANFIARRAGEYEEGGYNVADRNCTTFVADVTGEAGVQVGNVFQQEKMKLGMMKKLGIGLMQFAGAFVSTNSNLDYLEKRKGKKDARYGVNKDVVSQEEIDRFKRTRKRGGKSFYGYAPSSSGERMRKSKKGEFSGRISGSEEKLMEFLGAENLTQTIEEKIALQAAKSGPTWDENAGKNLRDSLSTANLVSACYYNLADPENRNESFSSFQNAVRDFHKSIRAWFKDYGEQYPILVQFAMDVDGHVEKLDEYANMQYSNAVVNFDSSESVRAFRDAASGSGELISQMAQIKALGGGAEGRERLKRYKELEENEDKTNAEKKEFSNLERMLSEESSYRNEILNHLDDDMERFETNGVKSGDLYKAFVQVPQEEGPSNEKTTFNSEGKFSSFSGAFQSATLRMLFGEAPIREAVGNQSIEGLRNGNVQMQERTKGAYQIAGSLIEKERNKVSMLMESLAKVPGTEKESDQQLASRTLQVIVTQYCIPVMTDVIPEIKRDERHDLEYDQAYLGEQAGKNKSGYDPAFREVDGKYKELAAQIRKK